MARKENDVVIETQWNVNLIRVRDVKSEPVVVIETQWNVNKCKETNCNSGI